jgi:hypothetical protein
MYVNAFLLSGVPISLRVVSQLWSLYTNRWISFPPGLPTARTAGDVPTIFFNSHSGVQVGPISTSATEWPIVPAPGDYDDGEFVGMKIGRGNRSTRRKPAPASLCPPQIPLDQTRARTRTAAVVSQWLSRTYVHSAHTAKIRQSECSLHFQKHFLILS